MTFNKREIKHYTKLASKLDQVRASDESLRSRPELRSFYSNNWVDLVNFRVCDAAKPEENYVDDDGRDITHIYSYNKVMSLQDLAGIATILNKTNYRVLAWYFNPYDSERCGLRDFVCLGRMPMQSTGGERFTVYVYFRTIKYVKGIEAAWDVYDEESDEEISAELENDASNDNNFQGAANGVAAAEGKEGEPILFKASK